MQNRWTIARGLLIGLAAAGCQTRPVVSLHTEQPPALCRPEFQDAVTLRISVVARQVPSDLQATERLDTRYSVVARRLLVAVVPKSPAAGAKILDSTLTITPYGGTFTGWGRVDGSNTALQVIPGRLRVTPFLASGALHAQTIALDAVVQAGGAPIDQVAITTGPLWDSSRQPLPADAVQVTLVPLRHFTAFDVVEANATLEFVAQATRGGLPLQCAVDTKITLMDRDAARPLLWDLATAHRGGARKRWLALYDPKTGPVRAIFTDPIAARGFAEWARQSGATHVSHYQIGVFEPEDLEEGPVVVPTDRAIMDSFRPLSPEDRADLTPGMLAEP